MKNATQKNHRHFTSFQVIILGFFSVILLGSLLLMLPISTRDGHGASFADGLFTATSAVCVTGLIVRDTATYWSEFGQAVILTLIQIGGMGVVTIAVAIAVASGRKIGLMQRSTMQEAISAHQVGGIVRLTKFILKTSISIELLGALLLAPVFCKDFGIFKGLWYSVFHSISAFCNAGFDLIGIREPFSSLTSYASNPIVNFTIMALIITGGLGFVTWADIRKNKFHFRKYNMQSKVILTVTAGLLIFPAIYFFFCEFSNFPIGERILSSLFQSVTPRTAGFNTVDLTLLTETGLMIMIILMLIGGSPGSTAGGMKTTTVAVLFSSALAVFRKQDSAHFFSRRIPDNAVKNAATILMMYLTLFLGGGMVISYIEKVPLMSALFETSSAIGTVGLSLGLTPSLGMVSKAILILLMFFGRVGGLTLIFAALSERNTFGSRYPQEKITVG
ncbi:MAG: potassium transporter TrkG [Blautia sp.]|uniref:TrkH family potassium uptake protein n=1 Tax=Blautia sp. TaxID=1955243 RepID=UPI002A74BC73|nr:potassium transporter TrkG [Blautia sp.]MDY3017356.1 potassium transporter TrkG [Blautia sp.]